MRHALLPIKLESQWILLDATSVREVLGAEKWLPLPHGRREVPGVLAWRGRAIPLVDLGAILARTPMVLGQARERTIVLEHANGIAAVSVDGAREVQAFEAGDLRPVHACDLAHATAEVDVAGTLMPVIDIESILKGVADGAQVRPNP